MLNIHLKFPNIKTICHHAHYSTNEINDHPHTEWLILGWALPAKIIGYLLWYVWGSLRKAFKKEEEAAKTIYINNNKHGFSFSQTDSWSYELSWSIFENPLSGSLNKTTYMPSRVASTTLTGIAHFSSD